MEKMISLTWTVGYMEQKDGTPDKYIPATVPGAVQLDIARAENYPALYFADNYKKLNWTEDLYYTYKTEFAKPALSTGEKLYFISKGIDYQFEIYLNDYLIHAQEGMFSPTDIDLTPYLEPDNELKIIVFPAPKKHRAPADRTQASHVVKPAVSYLWDWHPRLIPLGIWDDTYLEIRPCNYVRDINLNYRLSEDLTKVYITPEIEGKNVTGYFYKWHLVDQNEQTCLESAGKLTPTLSLPEMTLENPALWWPHDHGEPYLYQSVFELISPEGKLQQRITQKIGFRRIQLVMNEGSWSEPKEFPKSRSVSPAQFEINGRRIFAKGSNWVNPEIFPGTITMERYTHLIDKAVEANFNIFRIWGGGIINKEAFYELCDEKGIMVWQEFPLACNNYPDDPHYLSVLKQEATSILKRLRKHASICLWCGGNELFNNWSGMTDQSLPLRLLNSLCLEYDPLVPFNPTSPVMGMAHGHYVFYDEGKEVFQTMNQSHNTAYTEFGIPGISSRQVLEEIIPADELWPPRPNSAWEEHHAYGAWHGQTWLCEDILEKYFGKPKSLDELIEQSQLLQCEGYKAIFEEARRQKPYCAMALNWCYNEPWPSAANNSLLVYPAVPKPAYYAVGQSCRPVCSSARLSKLVWQEEECFFAEIWMLNDKFEDMDDRKVIVHLDTGNERIVILKWHTGLIKNNTNLAGPTARYKLPHMSGDRFKLILEVENYPEYNSEYTLLYRAHKKKKGGTAMMNVTD